MEKVEDTVKLQGIRMKEFEDKVNQGAVDEAVKSKMEELEKVESAVLSHPRSYYVALKAVAP